MKLRVLVADDHCLFRAGLRTLLGQQADMEVVGESIDGPSTLEAARTLTPDILLMDISMAGLNGIEATRRVLEDRPGTRVIMLSMHADQRFVIESLRAGAMGYVLKDSSIGELIGAIRTVSKGRRFLSGPLADRMIGEYAGLARDDDATAFSALSPRERQVLQLLAEGTSTKEMAAQLQVSVKTVETHRKQIMDKLDMHSVAELTKYAVREGLTPLE